MTGVWERNVTGRGVTVVVVDDGVEHTVQDIAPNYVSGPGATSPTSMAYLLPGVIFRLAPFLKVTGPNKRAWGWVVLFVSAPAGIPDWRWSHGE